MDGPRLLEGVHCAITIDEPAPGVVTVTIEGTDVGDLGDAPFAALAPRIERGDVELFIDASRARGPSIDVSTDWALWLSRNRSRLLHVSMITASPFVALTAGAVRRFADLGEVMRLYTDAAVFRGALSNAVGNAQRRASRG